MCYSLQELCRDPNIRVSLTKVFKPDTLVLVVHLTNQKQDEISSITLSIDPPTSLKVGTGDGEGGLNLTTPLAGFATVRIQNSIEFQEKQGTLIKGGLLCPTLFMEK